MRKIKYKLINELKVSGCTKSEILFYLYISKMQEEDGTVPGIYYNDVCKAIKITKPTFYKVLRSLKEKNFINYEKEQGSNDYTVKLLNNDFSDGSYYGYLSTKFSVLESDDFISLNAKEMLMFLDLLKNSASSSSLTNIISREKFLKNYKKYFGIENTRTIDRYRRSLSKFFFFKPLSDQYIIGINKKAIVEFSDEYKKKNEIFVPDKSLDFLFPEDINNVIKDYEKNKNQVVKRMEFLNEKISDRKYYSCHLIKKIMRANKIQFAEENHIEDVAKLLFQYSKETPSLDFKNVLDAMSKAIADTIFLKNIEEKKKKKWKRLLEPPFIHERFREHLGLNVA